MCGEHAVGPQIARPSDGSSPRVRGTPAPPVTGPCERRFIPACAGNTRQLVAADYPLPVHPRVCGEHGGGRGDGAEVSRFIPACAGNTSALVYNDIACMVHPRVCGEHYYTRGL